MMDKSTVTLSLAVARQHFQAARPHRGFALRGVVATGLALSVAILPTSATAAGLIRDAEIEGLLRDYANPIFRVAGLNPSSVEVNIIGARSINAYVSGGQRVFIHTGLITEAETPNQVIGVLAHETGHIAGAHLARMRGQIDRAQTASIVSMLLGAAAVAGGAAAGARNVGAAGQGIVLGGQGLAQRTLLSYQRAQEAAADQAALSYLTATKQSGQGMIDLFDKLANQAVVSLRYADPYVLSHPMPRDRVRLLESMAAKSKYFGETDSPALLRRHKMAQAKLHGFLEAPSTVYRRYPTSDTGLPARYARAIAAYRQADTRQALASMEKLIREQPDNPYFWELKGQALFEGGMVRDAVAPLRKAVALAPKSGLIRILLAQAQLASENAGLTNDALENLRMAARTEPSSVTLHQQFAIAYARKGDIGRADLASAEAAFIKGDLDLAKQRAKRAMAQLRKGTPAWIKANDIVEFKKPKS
jgi:predicted Zn-dependent protease